MFSKHPRIALFVDADNISPEHEERIIKECQAFGKVSLGFVCGRSTSLKGWQKVSETYGFRQKEAYDIKNSADTLIADEMNSNKDYYDVFFLVSNDGDFATIINALNLNTKAVILLATNPNASLKKACTKFIDLTPKTPPKPKTPKTTATAKTPPTSDKTTPKAPTDAKKLPKAKASAPKTQTHIPKNTLEGFVGILSKAFGRARKDDKGYASLTELGQSLRAVESNFTPNIYGSATLTKLLKRLPSHVEVNKTSVKLKQ